MSANQILIIVIGLFFLFTGVSYLIQIKKEEGDINRKKTVSYVLIALGIIISILPIYSFFSTSGSGSATEVKSNKRLLGQEVYKNSIPKGNGSLEQANELYIKAIAHYNEAYNLFDSTEVTMELLTSSITSYETAEAYTARGRLKIQMGSFEQAFSDYDRALELNPNLGNTYFNRGSAHYILGNLEAACADWKKAQELNFPQANAVIGMCN